MEVSNIIHDCFLIFSCHVWLLEGIINSYGNYRILWAYIKILHRKWLVSQSVPKFARYKHFFHLTYALVEVIHHVRFQSSEDKKQIIAKEREHIFIDPPCIGTSSPGSRPRMALAFVTPRTKQRPWPWPKTVGRPFDHGDQLPSSEHPSSSPWISLSRPLQLNKQSI